MVNIVGNVKPEDDYTHPLGPEVNFNESVYFNFFDPVQNRGGFIRMGNRANEGYAEMTIIIFNPDGSVLFNYKKPEINHNDGWDAGGARIEVITPGEKIRTLYDGSVLYMTNSKDMQDPGRAFKANPFRKLKIDLIHEGVGPMYGHVGDPDDSNDFARAHYEQHMKISGSIEIEDVGGSSEKFKFSGHGMRDHSWGPRFWQSIRSYRWITGNFGDNLGMAVSIVGDRKGGMFYKGDKFLRITEVDLSAEYEEGTRFHKSFVAKVSLENGDRHVIEGSVKGFIPLRNRRSEQITYIGEGMTEYVLDGDRVGYGLSEFLDQPGDEL